MQPPCQLSLITTLSGFIHFYGFRVKHHWIDAVFSPCIWRISPACGENCHVVRRTRKAGKFRATPSLRGPVRPDGRRPSGTLSFRVCRSMERAGMGNALRDLARLSPALPVGRRSADRVSQAGAGRWSAHCGLHFIDPLRAVEAAGVRDHTGKAPPASSIPSAFMAKAKSRASSLRRSKRPPPPLWPAVMLMLRR